MTNGGINSRWAALGLLALSCALYVGSAGSAALVDDDIDAAHALVAREMLQRHDYVVMYMDGIRYLIRPPLHFWMIAASYSLLGENEFSTRLPLALAMIGLVLLTFDFGRRFFDNRTGLYGGLVVATSVGMFIFTRGVIPEAIYALEFTAIFYLFLRSWTGSLDPRLGYWGAAAICALAVLTRGLIGLIFPGGAILAFITLTRGWRRWRELRLFSSFAIFLAVAAPWHILAGLRAPGFFWAYFINENVNRALGTRLPHDYSAVPLWLWWAEHFIWLFPWSLFAPLMFRDFPARSTWASNSDPKSQARFFLFVWAGLILLFFTIESGSRMEYYSFGAWPALALLLGYGLAHAEMANDRWLLYMGRAMAALGIVIGVAAGAALWFFARNSSANDFSSDVRPHGTDFYQSSMAHILDLTPKALADLHWPILIAAVSVVAALLGFGILREKKHAVASTLALALGMVGFFLAATIAEKAFDPTLSSRALAFELNKTLRPGDQVAVYGDIRVAPSIAFYSHLRLLLYNATGSNLEFGSHYPDAPKTFFTDQDFRDLWQGAQRVLLVVSTDKNDEVLQRLPKDDTWILAAEGGKTVYVNQPPDPGSLPLTSMRHPVDDVIDANSKRK
jgi:4-amino-4-deoxy-L-arabinose transferase-like glycosyltransferase